MDAPKVLTAGGAASASAPASGRRKPSSEKTSSSSSQISNGVAPVGRQDGSTSSSVANMTSRDPNPVHVMVAGGVKPTPSSSSPTEMDLISLGESGAAVAGGGSESDGSSGRERRHENKTPAGVMLPLGGGQGGGRGRRRQEGAYYDEIDHDDDEDGEFEDIDPESFDGKDPNDADPNKVPVSPDDLYNIPPKPLPPPPEKSKMHDLFWLGLCFFGIMVSFVCYGLLLEYTTSGGRKLHELSFLFVTSALYTVTAATGRYVRDETPSTIPPARFAVLGMTSMGSTFCSVRSLRYVIYPIQVLAKSCKPVPVMIMGAFMGKKYPLKKYLNVVLIVGGVALFMGGGDKSGAKKPTADEVEAEVESADSVPDASPSQIVGILLLFISLCFDGGTGAYEDKLMSVHSVGPFDLMYNIQLGKTILAGIGLLVLNQVHVFVQMVQEMGFLLLALGLSGAMGQVFIFVTIAKFGALTCSIIGLARKVTTLVASIYFYGHALNGVQFTGLGICITAMVMNFWGKSGKGGGHGHGGGGDQGREGEQREAEEEQGMLCKDGSSNDSEGSGDGDVELKPVKKGEVTMV